MKNTLKIASIACALVGVAVIGHAVIEKVKYQWQKTEARIACEWLGRKLLTDPSDNMRNSKVTPELLVLESHCWESKRVSALVKQTKKARS